MLAGNCPENSRGQEMLRAVAPCAVRCVGRRRPRPGDRVRAARAGGAASAGAACSCEPAVQVPAVHAGVDRAAGLDEGPGTLTRACFDDVVVAALVAFVPPAALD